MVSITKLYLILRKKLLFVSVLPIEKARSYRITLGITEAILTGLTSSMHYFSQETNFNSYHTVVGSFTLHWTTNQRRTKQCLQWTPENLL